MRPQSLEASVDAQLNDADREQNDAELPPHLAQQSQQQPASPYFSGLPQFPANFASPQQYQYFAPSPMPNYAMNAYAAAGYGHFGGGFPGAMTPPHFAQHPPNAAYLNAGQFSGGNPVVGESGGFFDYVSFASQDQFELFSALPDNGEEQDDNEDQL